MLIATYGDLCKLIEDSRRECCAFRRPKSTKGHSRVSCNPLIYMANLVGVIGFEPTTPCTPFNTLAIYCRPSPSNSLVKLLIYQDCSESVVHGCPYEYQQIRLVTVTERQPE